MNSRLQKGARSTNAITDLLKQLYPAQAVILANNRCHDEPQQPWPELPAERILLIEPEAGQPTAGKPAHGEQRHTLLAAQPGEVSYYQASNPAESGLIPIAALTGLWPNLRELNSETRMAQPLQQVLADPELAGIARSEHTWLIVDSLSALAILQGAGEQLEKCNLLWLRTLRAPLKPHQPGTTLAELQECLQAHHYRHILSIEENHPNIIQVLFLRDDVARKNDKNRQLDNRYTALQQQLDALSTELAELRTAREALTQEKTSLFAERDQHQQLATERQQQLASLGAELTKLRGTCEALTREKTSLCAERDQRIQQLETDLQESLTRLRLMQGELSKGEAQIELIKELLLQKKEP